MADEKLLQAVFAPDVSYENVRVLLAEGADPCAPLGATRQSALFRTIERGDENLLQLVLSHSDWKSVAAARSSQGLDALMLAARQGHVGCVILILTAGFSAPDLLNRRVDVGHHLGGNTALMLACTQGHTEVARELLDCGADPNLSDGRGCSTVHVAAVQGNVELLQELGQHGAMFAEALDHRGNTPMHFCSHPSVLEFLYDKGVSPCARNHRGSTALDVLRRMKIPSTQAISLLQQLEEDEVHRERVARLGRGGQLLWGLWWLVRDVKRDVGWKVMTIVVVVTCLLAWQLTIYLHGKSPLGPYPAN